MRTASALHRGQVRLQQAELRIRLTLEVTKAVADAVGADRAGIRLSPANGLGDTAEDDYGTTYPLLVAELDKLGLAYLHLIEAGDPSLTPVIRRAWSGALILNAAQQDPADHPQRLSLVADGSADAVSFGRLFISNPDLVARLASAAELTEPDLSKAYGGDHRGYTDYPSLPTPRVA
jgi:N-ethylmaleimide reductase